MEYRARIDRTRLYRQCREHIQIVDCLLAGDVPGASYLMRAHLMGALQQKSAIARNWAGNGAVSDGPI